jgi:hypothetical protein
MAREQEKKEEKVINLAHVAANLIGQAGAVILVRGFYTFHRESIWGFLCAKTQTPKGKLELKKSIQYNTKKIITH